MKDEIIHEKWVDGKGVTLKFKSTKGKYKFSKTKEDRLFCIQIGDSQEFCTKHEHHLKMLELLIKNDIKSSEKAKHIGLYRELMDQLERNEI